MLNMKTTFIYYALRGNCFVLFRFELSFKRCVYR